ncbi:hypothetical protein [Streptomyces sp. NPDC051452]|uniref:hypothetical protein n=1 Tax=Streptomyces sp. NPDC051452 TaxID=3365654 RepID=UPI0037ABFE2D
MKLTDERLEFIRDNFEPSSDFAKLLKKYDEAQAARDAFVADNKDCHALQWTEEGPVQITPKVITEAKVKKHAKDKLDIASGKPLGDHSKLVRDAEATVARYRATLKLHDELIRDARKAIEDAWPAELPQWAETAVPAADAAKEKYLKAQAALRAADAELGKAVKAALFSVTRGSDTAQNAFVGSANQGRTHLHPAQAWQTSGGTLTEESIQALQITTMVDRKLPQVPTFDAKAMQLHGWARLEYLRSQILELIPAAHVRVRNDLCQSFLNEDIELGRVTVSQEIRTAEGHPTITQRPYSEWSKSAKDALENFDFADWINL